MKYAKEVLSLEEQEAFQVYSEGQKGKHSNIWGMNDTVDAFIAGMNFQSNRQLSVRQL